MPSEMVGRIGAILARHRFRFANEKELQDSLAVVFLGDCLPFEREHRLGGPDVIDFLVGGSIGVEVKCGGSLSAVTRQLHRYAGHPEIEELVLISSLGRLGRMPDDLQGVPLHVFVFRGAFQ
jgi:hypothetical protein